MSKKITEGVVNALQEALCAHARECVYLGKTNGAKKEVHMQLIEKIFHGSESHKSALSAFMNGEAPYDCLFDVLPQQNNREGNDIQGNRKVLALKELFHLKKGTQLVLFERGFVAEKMANDRKGQPLTGDALHKKALNVLNTNKHALKFYQELCPDGKLPSGTSVEDMHLYVRKKMFVFLNGAKDTRGSARVKSDKSVMEEQMPADYMFCGQVPFMMFGPHGYANIKLSCMSLDGKDIAHKGRKAAKEKKQAQKKAEKGVASAKGLPDYHRAVPIQQKQAAAQMAAREHQEKKQNICEMLFIASSEQANSLAELKQCNEQLNELLLLDVEDRPREEYDCLTAWKREIREDLNNVRAQKKILKSEMKKLMDMGRVKQIDNYFETVHGCVNLTRANKNRTFEPEEYHEKLSAKKKARTESPERAQKDAELWLGIEKSIKGLEALNRLHAQEDAREAGTEEEPVTVAGSSGYVNAIMGVSPDSNLMEPV